MASLTIRLSAPAQWHALARAASGSWPAPVMLRLRASDGESDDGVVVDAQASATADPHLSTVPPRPGAARATIVGATPMTADSFTLWAQRALLGTADPARGGALDWTLPYEVTEVALPADARASHHARTAMRSIGSDLACIDDVLLATSELTANALQHGTGPPRLTAIRRDHSVTVALSDRRPDALPVVRHLRGVAASSGRGMAIVNEIAHHWGITVYHDRKVVWCELSDHDATWVTNPGL
jgi:anti-sigma regulatory factor (Ser/Thr protein kinase)